MAAPIPAIQEHPSFTDVQLAVNGQVPESRSYPDQKITQPLEEEGMDYTQRAQWLRAAVLGANDGLVTVASLMMGIGSVKDDIKGMLLAGFAGLVAGACSMAIGEYVSVSTQSDIEAAQKTRGQARAPAADDDAAEKFPNPAQAALASALAFAVGAILPLLAAAFVKKQEVRLGVVVAVASMTLILFGGAGAVLGKTSVVKSSVRVLLGGWMAMGVTFGLTKLIGSHGMQME